MELHQITKTGNIDTDHETANHAKESDSALEKNKDSEKAIEILLLINDEHNTIPLFI